MTAKKPGTNITPLKEVPTGPQFKTLIGQPTTIERCPYLNDEPHVFIILNYAPGAGLQTVCQHCLLLTTFALKAEETEPLSN